MLQAAGRTSSICLRRVPRGIPRSLIIPHHGIVFQRAQSDTESPAQQQKRFDRFSSPRRRRRILGRAGGRTAPERSATDTVESPEDEVIQWSELETSSEAYQLKDIEETLQEDSELSQPKRSGKNSEERGPALEEQVTGLTQEKVENFDTPLEPHFYEDGEAPPDQQLLAAGDYFKQNKPKFAFSCSRFLEFPDSSIPEFCFIGRSNVGKSSLLNALFHASSSTSRKLQDLAVTSHRAGRTKTLNVFLAGDIDGGTKNVLRNGKMRPERWISTGCGIAIIDMPGYGFGSNNSQGEEILKYLSNRKQLRRTFVLLDSDHGPTKDDKEIFRILEQAGISYQMVMTKVDKYLKPRATVKTWFELLRQKKQSLLQSAKPPIRDILCVSATMSPHLRKKYRNALFGMNGLRLAMLQAAGLDRAKIPVVPTKASEGKKERRKREKEVVKERRNREKAVVKERRQARLLRREMQADDMEQEREGGRRENASREERSGRQRGEDHDRKYKRNPKRGNRSSRRAASFQKADDGRGRN